MQKLRLIKLLPIKINNARREVVRDDDRDVRALVHGVQQARHARMGEGRVADYGYRRELSAVGSALAIVTEAPISTQVSIARNGGSEPSV